MKVENAQSSYLFHPTPLGESNLITDIPANLRYRSDQTQRMLTEFIALAKILPLANHLDT